ncbi:alpha/beta hydrolase [Faunimonas sp. B44]|uniref:alpha/beta hydrolase n=1 Tax=Faunimonas sp. B44 TaxID=3461493 RepID=UPI0040448B8C
MGELRLEQLTVGQDGEARPICVLHRAGKAPGLFWLGGFRSDMAGTKAEALDGWAGRSGHEITRFDYSGHGRSGGRFEDGSITRWLEEAAAVFDRCAHGPQIVVGSSMGGWIALLLARQLRERGEAERLAGMVLLAPAVDMTKDLMWDLFDEAAKRDIAERGYHLQPSAYSDEPYRLTRLLIEDGGRHLFGPGPVEVGCPVRVIQGKLDPDVPWTHATALMERLAFDDAVLTLVPDGDHRLSRPEDIAVLLRTVEDLAAG